MTYEKLAKLIAEILNVDPKNITPDSDLVEDLGADSLDVYQIVIAIEEELGVDVDDDKAEKVRKISEIQELIEQTLG